jgi:hypothetical protein
MLANMAPQPISNPFDIKPGISNISLSTSVFASQLFPALNPADFPLVQFWNKSAWKKHAKSTKDTTVVNQRAAKKGNTQVSESENVTMQFVEDREGHMIDGHRAGEIRKHTHSIFNDITKWMTPPATWGATSSIGCTYYH